MVYWYNISFWIISWTDIKSTYFITGIQKKFNLVIYPNKTKPREFIVEEFNDWYKKGEVKDFNRYINLDKKIEVIPANNLAVNQLNFGDTLDGDYVSQQFQKANNREYGKSYYVDTENFFSQGKFEVKTTFASSPLVYLEGTGLSGSFAARNADFGAQAQAECPSDQFRIEARAQIRHFTTYVVSAEAISLQGQGIVTDCSPPDCTYLAYPVAAGDTLIFSALGPYSSQITWAFTKTTDSGPTILDAGTGYTRTFYYTITTADISSGILQFYADVVTSG